MSAHDDSQRQTARCLVCSDATPNLVSGRPDCERCDGMGYVTYPAFRLHYSPDYATPNDVGAGWSWQALAPLKTIQLRGSFKSEDDAYYAAVNALVRPATLPERRSITGV